MKTEQMIQNRYEYSPIEILNLLGLKGRLKLIKYGEDSIIVLTEEIN
jgi:hypothetical protein